MNAAVMNEAIEIVTPRDSAEQAARRFSAAKLRNRFEMKLYRWREADGTVRYFVIRLKHPDTGEKWVRPMHLNEAGEYVLEKPPAPETGRILYNLPALLAADPDTPLFIVEGEPCADALIERGVLATTSGSSSSADKADWTPAGRFHDVRLWPDNDKAGQGYADAASGKLKESACTVARLDVAALNLPNKGDAVDWLRQHPNATADDVLASPTINPAAGGDAILAEVHGYVGRFVAYPSEAAHVAHTLWIVHAHLMETWDSTPRIAFLSPEPGSGKSRALEVTEPLVPRPVCAVNVSPAYIFRKVGDEGGAPTLLYDEIDTVFGPKAKENEEIRGLLNAGHRKGAYAGRCVVHGKQILTEEIPAYCAVALAGLGGMPDTILSRAVVVRMRRRAPGERVEPYRQRINAPQGEEIRERLAEWCAAVRGAIEWPDMPSGIEDRNADIWEALLAVADVAGGDWRKRARDAAVALVAESKQSTPSLGVLLLKDLRTVFRDREAMSTEAILEALNQLDESPWGDLHGKPLNARGLSNRLRKYGIKPGTVRIGSITPKGYKRKDLDDAWSRYLPPLADKSATSATSATNTAPSPEDVADVADVADLAEATGEKEGEPVEFDV